MVTEEQKRAASFLWEKPIHALQVVAGAGTGKTTTLLFALSYATKFIDPTKIALITFTRKASHEMRDRLLKKDGHTCGYIGTMHSLAWKILREKNHKLKVLENREKFIQEVIRKKFPNLSHIPAEFLFTSNYISSQDKKEILALYQNEKNKKNLVDFDDMIQLVTQKNLGYGLFEAILVDEFQDTSPDQLEFIKSMGAKKIFAVGDDWQSIYKFRGADVSISLNFEKYFPNSKRLFLTKNFRSQSKIVKISNKAIKLSQNYIPKKLKSQYLFGKKPILFLHENSIRPTEAIKSFQEYRKKKKDLMPRTFLVRTNLLKELISAHIWPQDQVMTIHAAKGLEFENVTVFGISKDYLPHPHGDYDEEVRIFYVAMSRAKKILEFVAFGGGKEQSPFLPFLAKNCQIKYLI